MLRFSQEEGILTRVDAMRYIGQRFRIKADLPHWTTDEAICDQLIRYPLCIIVIIVIYFVLENMFVFIWTRTMTSLIY